MHDGPYDASQEPSDASLEIAARDCGLLRFLSTEFHRQGLDAVDCQSSDPRDRLDWTLSRDEFGFIIHVPGDFESPLGDYLEHLFGAPHFHHDRTRIYRNDRRKVSAMLNGPAASGENCDSTQLIVLLYSDPAVEQQISDRCEQAIERLFTDALTETNQLMDELQQEPDERRQAELLDTVEAKLIDLDQALQSRQKHLGSGPAAQE